MYRAIKNQFIQRTLFWRHRSLSCFSGKLWSRVLRKDLQIECHSWIYRNHCRCLFAKGVKVLNFWIEKWEEQSEMALKWQGMWAAQRRYWWVTEGQFSQCMNTMMMRHWSDLCWFCQQLQGCLSIWGFNCDLAFVCVEFRWPFACEPSSVVKTPKLTQGVASVYRWRSCHWVSWSVNDPLPISKEVEVVWGQPELWREMEDRIDGTE